MREEKVTDPTNAPRRRNHSIWIAVASILLAIIVYFAFFTTTPEEATHSGDAIQPSALIVEPAAPVTAD